MAIETGDNFSYKGRKPLDFRDTFDTILDMVSFAESSIDDGHVTYNKETDKHYKFNSMNDVDPILGKWREHNGSSTDEKVKLTAASTDAKYLEDLIDNSTIEIDTVNNCLVAKKIEGQTVTAAEINFLSGVTSNIQTQLDNLSKSMRMYGVFNTKADLLASTTPVPVDGNVAIITADEDNNNKQMTYIYIDSASKWTKVAECSITVRDFTTNPIDLDKETTGILPKEKIDAAIARLADVLDKNTYVGSADGIVKKADTLEGLTATIAQINQAINDSHTHPNISALNNIINNGLGNKYLADDGKYVELISISSKAPTSTYQLWVDIANANNPVLKIHDGTKWITISGGSSKIDIVKVNGTALPIDSTDNSVNINTYTKTPKWQPNTNYDTIGTEVEYDYKIYSVSTAHTSGTTFEPNNFTFVKYADIDVYSVSQAEYDQLVANGTITDKTRELYCVYDANNNNYNTGNSKGINIWASGEQYEVDNVCIYDDKIYKCKVANSDTVFVPSNWDRISGANVIYVTQTEYDDMKTAGTLSELDIYVITDKNGNNIIGGSNIDAYNKSEIDNKLKNKADTSVIGDINDLIVVGVTDLVSAINKTSREHTQSINLSNNIFTVTYKNGTTMTCDLSSLVSNIKMSDLSNIDDSAITDKQVLAYDSASNKYIPYTIDNASVLKDAKDYTDTKINTMASASRLVSDSKPTYSVVDDVPTITYVQDGETKTTTDTNTWFYYKVDSNASQTTFISGVEFTIEGIGSTDFTEYVNKKDDVVSTYTGIETDTSKIPDISALKALQTIVNKSIGGKVNTSDIIDDLLHTDDDKPLSANQGRELRRMIEDVSINISGGASVVMKKYFNNVVTNTEYSFDSPLSLNDCAIINCYNVASSTANQTGTLKEFVSYTKQDFIKDDNFVIDDNGAKIKDKYTLNSSLNSDGYYVSEEINKSDYSEILGIEVDNK